MNRTGNEPSPEVFNQQNQIVLGERLEDKRLVFQKGKQKELFAYFLSKYGWSHKELGRRIGFQRRNITSYFNERLYIKLSTFDKLVELDSEAKQFEPFIEEYLPLNWGTIKGGKKAMAGLWKKYGLETIRGWRRKESVGRVFPGSPIKEITVPEKITLEIAELLGAYLGDGTLTKYWMRISGDKRFDRNYFCHLAGIVERNFGLSSKIKEETSTNQLSLEIRSIRFVDFFMEKFSLKTGDKIRNQSKIPGFILADDELAKSCLRGLMDTDGSICRRSTYMCLAFTSYSPVLLNQVYELGMKFGYFSYKIEGEQAGSNSWNKIRKYFAEVGSSNLRHIVRFEERFKNKRFLYVRDALKYYPEYENVIIPYKGSVV